MNVYTYYYVCFILSGCSGGVASADFAQLIGVGGIVMTGW